MMAMIHFDAKMVIGISAYCQICVYCENIETERSANNGMPVLDRVSKIFRFAQIFIKFVKVYAKIKSTFCVCSYIHICIYVCVYIYTYGCKGQLRIIMLRNCKAQLHQLQMTLWNTACNDKTKVVPSNAPVFMYTNAEWTCNFIHELHQTSI